MKFHTLVLEGDNRAEKDKPHVAAYTKKDYLRRKWFENRPPLRNRSFYLCRMIEEALKGVDIDGSRCITICAHSIRLFPGNDKYICDQEFHVSVYYLEQEEIIAIEEADKDTEREIILGVLRKSLLDIAQRNSRSEDVIKRIERAFEWIISIDFVCEEAISKLTKRSKGTGLIARMYRVLSAETGEGWYLKIIDKKGAVICQKTIGPHLGYVNRLDSRLYARAEWQGDTFVIFERFGKKVFSLSVPTQGEMEELP